jgi:hypothetical protein
MSETENVITCDDCGEPAVRGYRVAVDRSGGEAEYDDYAYCAHCDPGPSPDDLQTWELP